MSKANESLEQAMQEAVTRRPKAAGFPYRAETLRRAGVTRKFWSLPSCQRLCLSDKGSVVMQGVPLISGIVMYRLLTERLSSGRCGFIRPARVPFLSFLTPRGALVSRAMTSTL